MHALSLSPFAVYLPILLPQPHPRRTQLLLALCTLFMYAMRCTRRACMCVCMCDRQDWRPSLSLPPSLPFSPAFPCFTFYHPSPFISVPFSFSHSPSFPLFCHRNARRKPQGKRKQEMYAKLAEEEKEAPFAEKKGIFPQKKRPNTHAHTHAHTHACRGTGKTAKTASKRTSYLKLKLKRTGMPHELSTICIRKAKLNE